MDLTLGIKMNEMSAEALVSSGSSSVLSDNVRGRPRDDVDEMAVESCQDISE